jgi:hypothetical protein
MDQEPDIGDEPLPPPTPEEEEAEAWEYWHQRAHVAEEKLHIARAALQVLQVNLSLHGRPSEGELNEMHRIASVAIVRTSASGPL